MFSTPEEDEMGSPQPSAGALEAARKAVRLEWDEEDGGYIYIGKKRVGFYNADTWEEDAVGVEAQVHVEAIAPLLDTYAAAALPQEARDVLTVLAYIRKHGGGIFAQRVLLGEDSFLEEEGDIFFKGNDCIQRAAEWCRAQGGEG